MRFLRTELEAAWLITPERIEDDRGFFARTWCEQDFSARGMSPHLTQCNISFNNTAGTLRGMHWQAEPQAEAKLVRCTSGAIFDVIADLRPASATFTRWQGFTLSASNRTMLYIPEGCAHGFVTIVDGSEVFYQMSAAYAPDLARGLNWADETIGIDWSYPVRLVSDRDRALPGFHELFPAAPSTNEAN